MPHIARTPNFPFVVAGGGIGGLACALALTRAHREVVVLERAPLLQEVGAGIQLGPNAVAVLHHWGLLSDYKRIAFQPSHLKICDVGNAKQLGYLQLAGEFERRYGHPYTTVHRADLHTLLLTSAQAHAPIRTDALVAGFESHGCSGTESTGVQVTIRSGGSDEEIQQASVLIGADGLWSRVRQQLLNDGAPTPTGHVAYRGLIKMIDLPQSLRIQHIAVWMGAQLHVVAYPVHAGQSLNVVVVSSGQVTSGADSWNAYAPSRQLQELTSNVHSGLQDLLQAITHTQGWQLWAIHEREPLRAAQYVGTRVALLGDAAHPMRPYLAQGAAMALEDACVLGLCVTHERDVQVALERYAEKRWRRNALVQRQARRNGEIFHATGVMKWARDTALQATGGRLLDRPWLYGARLTHHWQGEIAP